MINSIKRLLILQRGPPWFLIQQRMCLQCEGPGFKLWVGNIPWRRELLPSPVFLPEKFHGQKSLVGYIPRGHKESDLPEQLSSHTLLRVGNIKKRRKSRKDLPIHFPQDFISSNFKKTL